ncbi:hypothetical protein, partial [Oenococcus oeni]
MVSSGPKKRKRVGFRFRFFGPDETMSNRLWKLFD